MDYEIGDAVRLKSGGPAMTVAELPPDVPRGAYHPKRGKYKTEWLDDYGRHHTGWFLEETLEPAD